MTFDFSSALLLAAAAILFLHHRRASSEADAATGRRQAIEALRHDELLKALAGLEARMEQAEARQMQRNADQLSEVLRGVISDLEQRIVAGFERHLSTLAALAASTAELASKHRSEQMEAMHHARRIAGQIDRATREFNGLAAESTTLAKLAGDVRASLDVLGSRHEAVDRGMAKSLENLQAIADSVAALRPCLEEIGEQLASQTRRGFDAMSQRSALALNKELAEALAKATAGINKQLAVIAPLAQQGKRAAEAPRMLR